MKINRIKPSWGPMQPICVPAMCRHWNLRLLLRSRLVPTMPSPTRPDWLAPPRQWTAWWLRSVITFFCLSECLSFTVRGRRRGGGVVAEWRLSELESHSDLLTETPEHSKSFSWLGFHLCVRGRGCNTCSHGHLTFLSRSTQMRLVRPLHASGSASQHTK